MQMKQASIYKHYYVHKFRLSNENRRDTLIFFFLSLSQFTMQFCPGGTEQIKMENCISLFNNHQ